MFVEIHVIQNFAPSNLNRSDTGAPKDCDFGGYRRARVSSQCFKRAVREYFKNDPSFDTTHKDNLGKRTRLILGDITKRLVAAGKDEVEAKQAAIIALKAGNLSVKEDEKTEYLLFLGEDEVRKIADLCSQQWSDLMQAQNAFQVVNSCQTELKEAQTQLTATKKGVKDAEKQQDQESAKTAKSEQATVQKRVDDLKKNLEGLQKDAKKAIPKDIQTAMLTILDGGKAADLALFGRMLADLPEKNIDAASQVAHAISTHKTGVEFDFYTAVDDLLPQGETGAGMMGTLEFNSACFYRYANIDINQLKTNLKDSELEAATIEAFVRAFVDAVPTGKQNSYAAQQKPSFVMVVAREAGSLSLANAFAKPVPTNNGDLIEKSIEALDTHWGEMSEMYGKKGIKGAWFASAKMKKLEALGDSVKAENDGSMIDTLVAQIKNAIKPNES